MNEQKLNPYFKELDKDYLYHLGLDSGMNLKQHFGDVRYVVLTSSFSDSDYFSDQLAKSLYGLNDTKIRSLTIAKDERYHIHKIGHTLIISHGLGHPSMLICLNEITKLLWHAGVKDFKFFRIGHGGGLNTPHNSVVIASEAVSPTLEAEWQNIEFGEYHSYSSIMDPQLTNDIIKANENTNISIIPGKIMAISSFFNGQARVNGSLPLRYSEAERLEYLNKLYDAGVRGIDMESTCFAAFCNYLEIPASIILATVVDRLNDSDGTVLNNDKHSIPLKNAAQITINYILKNKQN